MKITQRRRQLVEEIVAIQCDKCGKRLENDNAEGNAWIEFQERLSIAFTGGYGSILGDGCQFEVDLCQHCVQELLGPYLRQVRDGYLELSDKAPGKPAKV